MILATSVSKSFVFKMLSVHAKMKVHFFTFFRFEERFRKAPFSCLIIVEGRPNWRNIAAF